MDELYQEPKLVEVYDTLNSSRADFDFYRAQLPPAPVAVADLGCGTGSFAIELSDAGYAVTGIEPAAAMLACARAKDPSGKVRWIEGTMVDVPKHVRFDAVVMTGHAFQCILRDEDITSLFQQIEQHLCPGGVFLFETRNPAARAWERCTPEHAGAPVQLADGSSVRVIHQIEHVDGPLVTFSETYEFAGPTASFQSISTLRFMTADQIAELAYRAGLSAERVWGDWNGVTYEPEHSEEIIFWLERRSEAI